MNIGMKNISLNKNIPYYFLVIGIFVLLKFWMGTFENEALAFLLRPTNEIIELLTGSHSVYEPELGYFYNDFNVVVDKSCSGYNFLLLCFVMTFIQVLRYLRRSIHKVLLLFTASAFAYVFTVLVNSARIVVTLFFQDLLVDLLNLSQNVVHESLGVITYLTFLLTIYLLIEKVLNNKYAQSIKT
jgi:exosortase K